MNVEKNWVLTEVIVTASQYNLKDKLLEEYFKTFSSNYSSNGMTNEEIFEDDIQKLSEEEFNKSPLNLSLAYSFYEGKIYYTYNDYLEHLELTKEYEKKKSNYKLNISSTRTFRNIQVLTLEKNWVMISKDTSPSIHFVIHHPKLREAIENFKPPIIE